MTDERIKEEFERWDVNPYSAEEINFAFTSCEKNERKASFYAGFRAAERFAKIEVLESVITVIDCAYPKQEILSMISELKAGQ